MNKDDYIQLLKALAPDLYKTEHMFPNLKRDYERSHAPNSNETVIGRIPDTGKS